MSWFVKSLAIALIAGFVLVGLLGAWFLRWRRRVAAYGLGPGLQLLLVAALPALLAHWLLHLLQPLLFGLLWIPAAAALLLYSFGRGDFRQLQERYRDQCRRGDFEGAWLRASAEIGLDASGSDPRDSTQAHATIQRALLYEGYQRWFAVLFYFFLLGPAGALAYRLLQMAARNIAGQLPQRCLFLADWIPARLLAATFSLTGDFVGSSDEFLAGALDVRGDAADMLFLVAQAAAGVPAPVGVDDAVFGSGAADQSEAFAGLLSRSAASWVVVISLVILLL